MVADLYLLVLERFPMSLRIEYGVGVVLIQPGCEQLEAANSHQLKRTVRDAFLKGNCKILIDLSLVNEIDSFGIVTLLSCHKLVQPEGKIVFSGLQKQIMNGISLTRLRQVLNIAPDKSKALSMLGAGRERTHSMVMSFKNTFLSKLRHALVANS